MKKIFIFCLMLVIAGSIQAQNKLEFHYDAAGNRIQRVVSTTKVAQVNNETIDTQTDETIEPEEDKRLEQDWFHPIENVVNVVNSSAFWGITALPVNFSNSYYNWLISKKHKTLLLL